jgi:hypothetical protein
MVAVVPVEFVLGVSAEKEMVAVRLHCVVGMLVGVVRPLMAKPDTWA